jgi:L-seryl-tRNA(Ser) seleniumtransferase
MSAVSTLAGLPKIDALVKAAGAAAPEVARWALLEAARAVVAQAREAIKQGARAGADVDRVLRKARALEAGTLGRVVNATGVVLHTGLGRAPLGKAAVDALVEAAAGYVALEQDVDDKSRGSRHAHVAAALGALTGAEAACVVNNGAAGVLLGLAALAEGREVVVSRGELVEIGGSFRVPDIMRASGAKLVEVGTTNKTHARDVEDAIGERTALLLKVHRSNFTMHGFVAEVALPELVALGKARGLPVMVDLGSGAVVDLAAASGGRLPAEATVQAAVAAGADLVVFSGDKLLGGPQAGVMVGTAAAVERCKGHPLMRALRPDKLTLAALAATLAVYRRGALDELPALAMLTVAAPALRERADRLRAAIGQVAGLAIDLADTESMVGGGALPEARPASVALALTAPDRRADALDQALRQARPAVVGRIHEDRLLLDVRTVLPADEAALVAAVRGLAS